MRALPAGPPAQGLYDPRFEHDACGVAFVATLTGEASHDIVLKALTALRNLDHRGAAGAEVNSGDGAGILLQVPMPSCARSSTSTSPGPAPMPSVRRSSRAAPTTSPRPGSRSRSSPTRRA